MKLHHIFITIIVNNSRQKHQHQQHHRASVVGVARGPLAQERTKVVG